MTATLPARPDAAPRPVPWRRMIGIIWRQHRGALASVAALLGLLAVWLWISGTSLHDTYAAALACHPASSAVCQNLISNTFSTSASSRFMSEKGPGGVLLQLLPALIGAFVGATVLARELETGTFRYAWTQGFGRWRWALAKLVALGGTLAAATAAFGALVSWYYQPLFSTGGQAADLYQSTPLDTLFALREVTFPAWTLAAFTTAALAGMLIRRVVPAIVATFAVYAPLAIAAGAVLREHYLTPLVTHSLNPPGTGWIIGQWWTKSGRFAFSGPATANLFQYCSSATPGAVVKGGGGATETVPQCLAKAGYTMWTSYQPASRFWPFQLIEGGWLLVLSALLIATTVWLVQRHAA